MSRLGRQDGFADKQSLDVYWAAVVHRWLHLVATKAKDSLKDSLAEEIGPQMKLVPNPNVGTDS